MGKLKLNITTCLLPDITEKSNKRTANSIVTITIIKNKFPEFKYKASVRVTLNDDRGPLSEKEEERYFDENRNVVNILVGMASQDKIEKSTSKELYLQVKVKVLEMQCGQITREYNEQDYAIIDFLNAE